MAKTISEEVQLHAQVDGKEIVITESSVIRDLQLADEEDEVVYKELGDSLVRATTTDSSLGAEQDSSNITKTQSKATPNESSYQGTNSGGSPRVSSDEESLGEDASKQRRRIDAIDADEDITLVNDADKKMFDMDDLGGEEAFVAGQNENVVEEVVNVAQVSTAATTVTITTEEITLTQALKALKTSKPKVKGIVFQEPGTELEQDITKKQKVEDDKEKSELTQLMETIPDKEEVAIDAIPLAVKSPRIIDWKIHKEGKKSYYQIVRADGKSQMYMIFSQMVKSFVRKDLKTCTKDEVWKRQQGDKVLQWKPYDSYGVHSLMMQSMQICMLVEKKYPLTPHTLSMMLEKKLQINYESLKSLIYSSGIYTNQQKQSSIISQGVEEPILNALFDDPCHEPLHDVSTAQESSSNVQSSYSLLELIDTPMVEKNKLNEDLQETPVDATLYRGMIGSLMYLTSSRPKLIYAVCLCARYQAKPTKKHLHAEQVENGIVELYSVQTEYQLADIFTKPFPRERFNFLIEKLVMRSMSPETLKHLVEEEDE
nr:retrovirus-related Pol polyprotein from transposon TNT 1-94 [Tanacetum cinerariifolium]